MTEWDVFKIIVGACVGGLIGAPIGVYIAEWWLDRAEAAARKARGES